MAMVKVVPSGQSAEASGLQKTLDDALKSLGFRADPRTAPSNGVQLDAADYLAFSGSFLAGVAVGAVSFYEMAKLAKDILKD